MDFPNLKKKSPDCKLKSGLFFFKSGIRKKQLLIFKVEFILNYYLFLFFFFFTIKSKSKWFFLVMVRLGKFQKVLRTGIRNCQKRLRWQSRNPKSKLGKQKTVAFGNPELSTYSNNNSLKSFSDFSNPGYSSVFGPRKKIRTS